MDKELEKRHQKARKYAIVAIELVREGLFLDEFMTDKRASVRAAVVEYHPHLRKIMLTDKITAAVWRKYYNLLYTDTHPDKELLTRFLAIKKPKAVADVDDYQLDKLRFKLKAMNENVPTMTRTMTCGQLYQAGYDAWASNLAGSDLEKVSLIQYWLDSYENEVAYLLDTVIYKYQLAYSETKNFVDRYRELRLNGHDINTALELAQN